MTKEAIGTGKSVEEALQKAYAELGVTSDNSDFEILERPKRTMFGLRVTPAKVRVTVQVPDEVKKAPPRPQAPKQPVPPKTVERQPQPAPRQEQAAAPAPCPAAEPPAPPREITDESRAKVACAREYLLSIFRDMGLGQVEVGVAETGSGAVFTLSGEGLGVLIGRRGETLDSLQYLAGLVANRLEGEYFRITIDSGNYREKRERTLEQLAKKLSAQVTKTGRNMTLEPMNPYERRIIHATVQTIEGVTSSSIGEEPNRRVVISSTSPRRRSGPPRGRDGAPRDGAPRDGAPRDGAPRDGAPRDGAPRDGAPRDGAPRDGNRSGPRRDGGGPRGGRGGRDGNRPNHIDRNGPANITTRPNAFGGAPAGGSHIDDSAYEIEPPVRTAPRPAPAPETAAPKAPVPPEATDKPLYSKIDLD